VTCAAEGRRIVRAPPGADVSVRIRTPTSLGLSPQGARHGGVSFVRFGWRPPSEATARTLCQGLGLDAIIPMTTETQANRQVGETSTERPGPRQREVGRTPAFGVGVGTVSTGRLRAVAVHADGEGASRKRAQRVIAAMRLAGPIRDQRLRSTCMSSSTRSIARRRLLLPAGVGPSQGSTDSGHFRVRVQPVIERRVPIVVGGDDVTATIAAQLAAQQATLRTRALDVPHDRSSVIVRRGISTVRPLLHVHSNQGAAKHCPNVVWTPEAAPDRSPRDVGGNDPDPASPRLAYPAPTLPSFEEPGGRGGAESWRHPRGDGVRGALGIHG
jgi:hypothetical protein